MRGLKEKLKRKAGSLTAAQQDAATKEAELEAAALHVRRMAHQEQLLQEDLASHQASSLPGTCQPGQAVRASSVGGHGLTYRLHQSCMHDRCAHATKHAPPAADEWLDWCGCEQDQLTSTRSKLEEAKEQLSSSEHMVRWLNTQVCTFIWTRGLAACHASLRGRRPD